MPDTDAQKFENQIQNASSAEAAQPAISFKELKKLAKKDPAKKFELGLVYYHGKAKKPDPDKDAKAAFKCFKSCAKKLNSADAHYYLALCFEKGVGTKVDPKKAREHYVSAISGGNIDAKIRMAYLWQRGLGGKKDEIQAFNLFNEAAEQGSVDGRIAVADCYLNNVGVNKQDADKAVATYKDLAKTNVRAAYDLAYCYHTGQGVEKNTFMAGHYLVPAAKRGDVDAQCFLAQCFFTGSGVKRNLPKAAYWFKKAAANGSDIGRFNYAYCLENGLGVKRDTRAAFNIYEFLYKKGHVRAASSAARCYYYGFGVKQSLKSAVKCVKFGVKNNDAESLCYKGWFKLNGIKCRKSAKKAYKLFAKAYEKGSAAAAYALSELVLYKAKKKKLESAQAKSAEYRKFALDKNYPPATFKLALEKEGEERARLLNAAAERDYVPAIVRYAKELEAEFPDRAFELWQRAYVLGSLRGAYGLGRCYERGIGVRADREKAFVLFRQAAKSGYADAIAVVGTYYQKGVAVEMNRDLAKDCYNTAIRKGSTYALRRIAKLYAVKGKIKKAEKTYAKAIAFGDKEAVFWLADAYCATRKKKYYKKAVPVLRALVEEGDVRACALLAQAYDAIGEDREDIAEAANTMLQAGINGHCGNAYYYNALRALEEKDPEALSLNLTKAMNAGSDQAARLAVVYYTKKTKDPGNAVLAKEALIGFDMGDRYLYEVARAYEKGKVVEKDESKAAIYYALAWKRSASKHGKALKKLKKYTKYDGDWMTKKSAKKAMKAAKKEAKASKKAAKEAAKASKKAAKNDNKESKAA